MSLVPPTYPLSEEELIRLVRTSVPLPQSAAATGTEVVNTGRFSLGGEELPLPAPSLTPLPVATDSAIAGDTDGYPLGGEVLTQLERTSATLPQLAVTSAEVENAEEARRGAIVAIGAFDGVHRGHRALIDACQQDACARGLRSVVVTFDPDPSELLTPERAEHRLLTVADRMAFCRSCKVTEVVALPFTQEMAALEPFDFVCLLQQAIGPIVSIHVGSNFRFGHGGKGTPETLRGMGERLGFAVVSHNLLQIGGVRVSSSCIRELLGSGDVTAAAELLGRYHYVRGVVAHGRGEGTSFGFPTANVCCDGWSCLPREGVYACVVTDGTRAWPSAANVGAPPTFSSHRDAFLEANLLGFSGNLYDRELAVVFVSWLRASRPFSSLEELERVVLDNIAWVRDNIGACEVRVG